MTIRITKIVTVAVTAALICILTVAAVLLNRALKVSKIEEADNYLSALSIEGYTFSPDFSSDVFYYTMTVRDEIDSLGIAAVPTNEDAKIKILGNLGFTEGNNLITITVTAPDKGERIYEIVIDYVPSGASPDENLKGNLGKNLMGGGTAAIQGDYLYYLDSTGSLWKQKTDGSSRQNLAPEGCSHLNVVGEWVYYINDYSVYAVRTDGTQLHSLPNYKTGKNVFARYLLVYNDYLYYSNALVGNNGYLYRLPLFYDEDILPTQITGSRSGIPYQFIMYLDTIYYINESSDNRICTIPSSGGTLTYITDAGVSSFVIDQTNNLLYYIESATDRLIRSAIDGSEPVVVAEGIADFIFDGEYIICSDGAESYIFPLSDPTAKITLCSFPTSGYSIVGSYVYFEITGSDNTVQRYRFLRSYSGTSVEYTSVDIHEE